MQVLEGSMNNKASKGGKQNSEMNDGRTPFPGDEIGRKLNALYRSIEDEPVPDRIMELLEKLDEAERGATDARR